jgi:hypothetical protein
MFGCYFIVGFGKGFSLMINRIVVGRTPVGRFIRLAALPLLSSTIVSGCGDGAQPSPSPNRSPNRGPQIAQVRPSNLVRNSFGVTNS